MPFEQPVIEQLQTIKRLCEHENKSELVRTNSRYEYKGAERERCVCVCVRE